MFKCICGKEFESVRSYNGHKSHCIKNAIFSGKDLNKIIEEDKLRSINRKNSLKVISNKAIKKIEKENKSKLLEDL